MEPWVLTWRCPLLRQNWYTGLSKMHAFNLLTYESWKTRAHSASHLILPTLQSNSLGQLLAVHSRRWRTSSTWWTWSKEKWGVLKMCKSWISEVGTNLADRARRKTKGGFCLWVRLCILSPCLYLCLVVLYVCLFSFIFFLLVLSCFGHCSFPCTCLGGGGGGGEDTN